MFYSHEGESHVPAMMTRDHTPHTAPQMNSLGGVQR